MLEILNEQMELRELGLTDEEVDGYIEFYWDRYQVKGQGDVH